MILDDMKLWKINIQEWTNQDLWNTTLFHKFYMVHLEYFVSYVPPTICEFLLL